MAGKQYSLKAILSVTDKISPTLKKVDRGIGKIGRSFSGLSRASKTLASGLALPLAGLGALAGAGGFSLSGVISEFTRLGDSVDDASKKAGISVEALQKLQFAAKRGGMQTEDMTKAMAKLTNTMANALSGKNADAAALFKRLGISLKDANGQVKSGAEVMRGLAEAIKNNTDPTTRIRILTTIFGEQMARNLIPVLENGADGLDKMAAKAEELGIVIDKKTVNQAAHLGDVLDDFGLVVKSLYTKIGAQLAPIIEKLVGKFQDWIVKNKEFIAQRLEQIFDGIAQAIDRVDFTAALDGFLKFIETCFKAIDAVGGIGNVLKGFGLIIGVSLVGDLAKLGKALWGVGVAFQTAFGPWGIAIAAAVAAGVALYENWDTIKEKLAAVWDWVSEKYEKFTNILSHPIDTLRDVMKPKMVEPQTRDPQLGAPALTGMAGAVPDVVDSRMTGDIRVRIVTDEGMHAEVDDIETDGGQIGVEPMTYSFTD